MSFYPKNLLLTDLGFILVAATTTYLLQFTFAIDDDILSWFFRFMLYLLDFSILLAFQVANNMKDGIGLFHFLRLTGLVFAQGYGFGNIMFGPIIGLFIFRLGSLWINKWTGLWQIDPKNDHIKEQWNEAQQTRRKWCICLLPVSILVTLIMVTSQRYSPTIAFLTITFFCLLLFQVRKMYLSDNLLSRMISNSLHLNLFFYIAASSVIGRVNHLKWTVYYEECLLYLGVGCLLLRVHIGSVSWKFHKEDKELFQAVYTFSSHLVSKRFKNKDKFKDGYIKTLDRLSRIIALTIYYLSCIVTANGGHYGWLAIGVFMLNAYPIQNPTDNPFTRLQNIISFKLRTTVTLPFLLLAYSFWNQDLCHRSILYGRITGCQWYIPYQFWTAVALAFVTLFGQLTPAKEIRLNIYKIVSFSCPAIVLWATFGLECQSIHLLILSFYSLTLIFIIIRDQKLGPAKGQKKH